MRAIEGALILVLLIVGCVFVIAYELDNDALDPIEAAHLAQMNAISQAEAATMSAMRQAERLETQGQRLAMAKMAYIGGGVLVVVVVGMALTAWGMGAFVGARVAQMPVVREVQRGVFITQVNDVPMLIDTYTRSAVPLKDAGQVEAVRAKIMQGLLYAEVQRDAAIGVAQATHDPTTSHYLLSQVAGMEDSDEDLA